MLPEALARKEGTGEFLFVSREQDGGGIFSWSWLTEDSCLPVLRLGSEVPRDSARSRVSTFEGRQHLVPVIERQGVRHALPFFIFQEEKRGQAEGGNPAGWQAGCHVYPSSLRTEGGSDLEIWGSTAHWARRCLSSRTDGAWG
ncbi:hypothetical protein SRHO_G00262360 [Serrasalmus rhombeus]